MIHLCGGFDLFLVTVWSKKFARNEFVNFIKNEHRQFDTDHHVPLCQRPCVSQRLAQLEYVRARAEEVNWEIEVWVLGKRDDKDRFTRK